MYIPTGSKNSNSTEFDFIDTSTMLPLLFMFLALQYSSSVYSFDPSHCVTKAEVSVYKSGDMVVAAFFPLHSIFFDSVSEDPNNDIFYHQ